MLRCIYGAAAATAAGDGGDGAAAAAASAGGGQHIVDVGQQWGDQRVGNHVTQHVPRQLQTGEDNELLLGPLMAKTCLWRGSMPCSGIAAVTT